MQILKCPYVIDRILIWETCDLLLVENTFFVFQKVQERKVNLDGSDLTSMLQDFLRGSQRTPVALLEPTVYLCVDKTRQCKETIFLITFLFPDQVKKTKKDEQDKPQ